MAVAVACVGSAGIVVVVASVVNELLDSLSFKGEKTFLSGRTCIACHFQGPGASKESRSQR